MAIDFIEELRWRGLLHDLELLAGEGCQRDVQIERDGKGTAVARKTGYGLANVRVL